MKTWRKEAQATASWRLHQEGKREARELRRIRPTAKAAELETPRRVVMETQGRQASLVLWSTSSMVSPKARLNRPCCPTPAKNLQNKITYNRLTSSSWVYILTSHESERGVP